ncbi:MAG: Rpn family recombination-promoting nuclease/putative transposase [Roseburia sp.]|nr:Rpn family recombination-promoting nuclease/putative transposase [Roseburia sp.]MCM1241428.1 Rpn family recombination-promoting nuclease/putative transposase [Roseburia sp.]
MTQNHSVPAHLADASLSSFQNAHGPLPYNMTNDYLFRAVLQTNNRVLRGLVCSLLHLSENEITSVKITNPIILGDSIEKKEFRLDINVALNDNTFMNLEMQVVNQLNWNNRSLLYLCRSFDRLHHGQNYSDMPTVIHIGFLDFTLFEECPEFYSTYKLMNVKNHTIYNDNFTLCVVDLSQIVAYVTKNCKAILVGQATRPDLFLGPLLGRNSLC